MTDDRIYSFTGSVFLEYDQAYTELAGGTPVMRPRQLSVFKSSSTEQYQGMRYRDMRQRKQLNREQLNVSSSQAWSQTRIGISNQTFVSQPISSSRHEVQNRGCFFSGTQNISVGSIPFSASLYYEKSLPLKKTVYKWAATDAAAGGYNATYGLQVAASASIARPHMFAIDVSDFGTIVDVRVWVEVMQPSGSIGNHPHLGQFGLSLRSPGVSFKSAHPIRNFEGKGEDPGARSENDRILKALVNGTGSVEEFYASSYLLWEPASIFAGNNSMYTGMDDDFPTTDGGGDGLALRMPVWDRDMGMRTVFCDSAGCRNPRDIYDVYIREFAAVKAAGTATAAPNYSSLVQAQRLAGAFGSKLGNGYPWYSDTDFAAAAGGAAGSPPPGWITGAGGVPSTGEYATTGSNYGPDEIKPIYPLLDDVVAKKIYHNDGPEGDTSIYHWANWRTWVGHRPGLRGKEMNGRWILMVANTQIPASTYAATYLRQWRIEITYRQNIDTKANIVPTRKPRRSSSVPFIPGLRLIGVVSGSNPFQQLASEGADGKLYNVYADYFTTGIYVDSGYELENNRTIGRTFDLEEFGKRNYAVYTASVDLEEFSGSYSRTLVNTVLNPQSLYVGAQNTLSSIMRSGHQNETTEQTALRLLATTGSDDVTVDLFTGLPYP